MEFNFFDQIPIENFVIEDNIIKGVYPDLPETYQFGKLFLDLFDSKPDHVSQIEAETGEKITFAEMKEKSIRCALWLKKQEVGSGDVVTICYAHHLYDCIPVYATFYVGATHMAWNHRLSLNEARYLMRTYRPKVIFVSEETANVIAEAGKIEDFDGNIIACDSYPGLQSLKVFMQQQTDEEVGNFHPRTLTNLEDVACIVQTSGSTGPPKSIARSYGAIGKQIRLNLMYPSNSVFLSYTPLYWITSFMFCILYIFKRGTRIIHSQFDPEETCKVIEKFKVESARLSATALFLYCKMDLLNKYPLKSLKIVLVGSAKIHEHILDTFQKKLPHIIILNMMGCTETTILMIQTKNSKARGSSGFVVPGVELKICDLKTNKALGPNMPGELYAKSCAGSKKYYRNEAATRAAFDDEGWYRTGDLAYYDENGEFFIIDRIKEVMKYQNHPIFPNEIESVLLTHPGIFEVSVVSIPHEVDGEHLIAFVKKSPNSEVTEEELVKLSERLGETKKLHGGVKFLDDIPKTSTGKMDRQTLKKWAEMKN